MCIAAWLEKKRTHGTQSHSSGSASSTPGSEFRIALSAEATLAGASTAARSICLT
jgi:hypothetical protein